MSPAASATSLSSSVDPSLANRTGTASSGPGTLVVPGPPGPSASPSRGSATATATDTDSGRTLFLHSRQFLKVHLSNRTWDPPISSAPGVLRRQSSTGGYPTSAPVDAVFKAAAFGSADITAASDAACFHTSPQCMMPTRQWTVHVVVR